MSWKPAANACCVASVTVTASRDFLNRRMLFIRLFLFGFASYGRCCMSFCFI
ncbi:Uncharacterised protein [Vibrio cholerae]|nr:Uncharacterised protein [Vibrio cholerae]